MNMNFDLAKFFDKAFDNFKKTTPLLFSICLVSSLLLFLPESFKKIIKLDSLNEKSLHILGLAFIISASLIAVIILFNLFDHIKHKFYIIQLEKSMPLLTEVEKMLVLVMFHSNGHVISLKENDGITGVLIAKHIIYRANNVSDGIGLLTFQYALQPWVIKYCMKHKDFDSVSFEELERFREKHYQEISILI